VSAWLVLGGGGMLGRDLCQRLAAEPDLSFHAPRRSDVDVCDAAAVARAVAGRDVVINAAAWTDVDGAEARPDHAMAQNGDAVAALAKACAAAGARLLHLSTDYVFAGDATSPYPEDAPTAPINAYGRSKLRGEEAVLDTDGYVVRTAWLYGAHGHNFVATMLRLSGERDTVDVVDDQLGQPTWTRALADQLLALGRAALTGSAAPGAYHGTATGQTTWYGFARAVFEEAGLDPERVRPTTSDAYVRPAKRPAYSVLGHGAWAKAGLAAQPHWHDQIAAALRTRDFRALLADARLNARGSRAP
jgi:dTDP-4-dehydrorhamnose reductase